STVISRTDCDLLSIGVDGSARVLLLVLNRVTSQSSATTSSLQRHRLLAAGDQEDADSDVTSSVWLDAFYDSSGRGGKFRAGDYDVDVDAAPEAPAVLLPQRPLTSLPTDRLSRNRQTLPAYRQATPSNRTSAQSRADPPAGVRAHADPDAGRAVFGLQDLFKPDQPSLCVVSNGAECLLLDKAFFLEHSPRQLLDRLRNRVTHYPSRAQLQTRLQERVNWEAYKQLLVRAPSDYGSNRRAGRRFSAGPGRPQGRLHGLPFAAGGRCSATQAAMLPPAESAKSAEYQRNRADRASERPSSDTRTASSPDRPGLAGSRGRRSSKRSEVNQRLRPVERRHRPTARVGPAKRRPEEAGTAPIGSKDAVLDVQQRVALAADDLGVQHQGIVDVDEEGQALVWAPSLRVDSLQPASQQAVGGELLGLGQLAVVHLGGAGGQQAALLTLRPSWLMHRPWISSMRQRSCSPIVDRLSGGRQRQSAAASAFNAPAAEPISVQRTPIAVAVAVAVDSPTEAAAKQEVANSANPFGTPAVLLGGPAREAGAGEAQQRPHYQREATSDVESSTHRLERRGSFVQFARQQTIEDDVVGEVGSAGSSMSAGPGSGGRRTVVGVCRRVAPFCSWSRVASRRLCRRRRCNGRRARGRRAGGQRAVLLDLQARRRTSSSYEAGQAAVESHTLALRDGRLLPGPACAAAASERQAGRRVQRDLRHVSVSINWLGAEVMPDSVDC
uniref:Cyclic nucleotide-binding domain-containing protein n=1 Tax=Macrostomum lignano TaxID=282301 RepID=A0A1I8FRA7_9PLAT